MAAPVVGVATGAASVATVMAFMPFGVSFETLLLGGGCFLLGVAARAGAALFKKLDGTQAITSSDFARPFAATLCMIPVAASASCIVFLAAHVSKVQADAGCGGFLLIAGLRGLEVFQWMVDQGATLFSRFAPNPKQGGGGP